MSQITKITDQITVIVFNTTIWSGRRKLRPEDFFIGDGGNLPPDDVASLGSKKICDPEAIRIFKTIDDRMERACLAVGTRFLTGFAIPNGKLPALTEKLDRFVAEFNAAKQAFLAGYDSLVETWIAKHPEFDKQLRNSILTSKDVEHRLFCGYTPFMVGHTTDSKGAAALDDGVGGLADQLYREVAKEAETAFEKMLGSQGSVSRRSVRPLQRLHDKLDGLAFLDGGINHLTGAISAAISRLQNGSGPLGNAEIVDTLAIVSVLSSVERMKAVTKGMMQVGEYAPVTAPAAASGETDVVEDASEEPDGASPTDDGSAETEEAETSLYF